MSREQFDVLLVDDQKADVRLYREACRDFVLPRRIHAVEDGSKAIDFLYGRDPYASAPRPDLIVLDLNLPKMDGHEVLRTIKADVDLRTIPVVILSSSEYPDDIRRSYELGAACYIVKPRDLFEYFEAVRRCEQFWLQIASLARPTRAFRAASMAI